MGKEHQAILEVVPIVSEGGEESISLSALDFVGGRREMFTWPTSCSFKEQIPFLPCSFLRCGNTSNDVKQFALVYTAVKEMGQGLTLGLYFKAKIFL